MQTSTPPNNQTGSRSNRPKKLNAIKHGILCGEVLITTGACREIREFEELTDAFYAEYAPCGPTEQLLVEQLIALQWRWRRVLHHENAAIRIDCAQGVTDIRRDESLRDDSTFYGYVRDGWRRDIDAELADLDLDLEALEHRNPLGQRHQLARHVLDSASDRFDVNVDEVLGLSTHWDQHRGFSTAQIETVVQTVCDRNTIKRSVYWGIIRLRVRQSRDLLVGQIARRNARTEASIELATMPQKPRRSSIVRYEAHISRQFFRVLHELRQIQAGRPEGPADPEQAESSPQDVGAGRRRPAENAPRSQQPPKTAQAETAQAPMALRSGRRRMAAQSPSLPPILPRHRHPKPGRRTATSGWVPAIRGRFLNRVEMTTDSACRPFARTQSRRGAGRL